MSGFQPSFLLFITIKKKSESLFSPRINQQNVCAQSDTSLVSLIADSSESAHLNKSKEIKMKKMTVATLFTATMLLFSFNSAFAGNEGLPADRVIAAIQTAVAANPGLIHEVEVETKQGKLTVEVKIIDAKGQKVKVKVDPETNAVIPAK